ncbi:hypothetical protein D3C75_506460 [compost metagenome]
MLIVNGSEYHVKAGSKVTLDAGCELTLQAGGNFIKIDASGIQTSAIVNMGMGSPGKGTEWNGQLPDELTPSQGKLTLGKNKAESSDMTVRPELEEDICLECMMNSMREDSAIVGGN